MSALSQGVGTSWLRDAFVDVQAELELQMRRASQSISHAGTMGSVNEENWIAILEAYLPDRYKVASAIVIDSRGGRSDQIDIVVFDNHFTPTLLDQRSHRYVPAEAVYAVFECKPHIDKAYIAYAGGKAASVRALHRTSVSISHAGGRFPPKEPSPIVAGLLAPRAGWSGGLGDAFAANLPRSGEERLDCGCALADGAFDLFDGGVRLAPREGALMSFLFRLLGKLQSLGSVPAIDWAAYAAVLADVGSGPNCGPTIGVLD